jgi:uncharacterized protein YlxP (DUF503 family)
LSVVIAACRLRLYLPGCESLKDKRSRLKPLLARLHREFNLAAAEVDLHDVWQSAELGLVAVANESAQAQSELHQVLRWIERNRPEVEIVDAPIELR